MKNEESSLGGVLRKIVTYIDIGVETTVADTTCGALKGPSCYNRLVHPLADPRSPHARKNA